MNDSHTYDRSHMFHSSSHGRMSHGRPQGAARPRTFGERIGINRNRSSVQAYGSSMMAQGHMNRVAPRGGGYSASRPGVSSLPRPHSQTPSRSFSEPPTRYNPYS